MVHWLRGKVFVLVHTEEAPAPGDWDAYLDNLERSRAEIETVRTLVVTEGGGPDFQQRARLNQILEGKRTRAAIVTSSVVARGIVTALGWFNPDIRAFSFEALSEGMRYINLTHDEARLVRAMADVARESLGLPRLPGC